MLIEHGILFSILLLISFVTALPSQANSVAFGLAVHFVGWRASFLLLQLWDEVASPQPTILPLGGRFFSTWRGDPLEPWVLPYFRALLGPVCPAVHPGVTSERKSRPFGKELSLGMWSSTPGMRRPLPSQNGSVPF